MIKNRQCNRCHQTTRQELCRRIISSGADAFGWWCLRCLGWTQCADGGLWISRKKIEAEGINTNDLRIAESLIGERCAKCGARGAELHHWAPRAIFGTEADSWPKDYLCINCHKEWHSKLTPA